MATYNLTIGADAVVGTGVGDVFEGVISPGATGGVDTLDGAGGNDLFRLGAGSAGTIDGGAGIDTVAATGQDLGDTAFNNVEVLDVTGAVVMATVSQILSFSSITNSNATGGQIKIDLIGPGGTIDFTNLVIGAFFVCVPGFFGVTSGVTITGTHNGDILAGSSFDDVIRGGGGADQFQDGTGYGLGGDDEIYGDAGNDTFLFSGFSGLANGGGDNDQFLISRYGGDVVSGVIDGGDGVDTVTAYKQDNPNPDYASLGTATYLNVEVLDAPDFITYATIAQLSAFGTITNSTGANSRVYFSLTGAGGTLDFSTRVTGAHSAYVANAGVTSGYTVTGSANSDEFHGSGFNDTFKGGGGSDYLDGKGGVDTVDYSDKTAAVVVTLNGPTHATVTVGGVGEDTVLNVENVIGGSAADTLNGDVNANMLTGGAGDDALTGGAGADTLNGGANNDTYVQATNDDVLMEAVGGGVDTVTVAAASFTLTTGVEIERIVGLSAAGQALTGNAFDQTITGAVGTDTLIGGDGDDSLEGGGGDDLLGGGLGSDTVSYAGSSAGVTVLLYRTTAQNTIGAGVDTLTGFEHIVGSGLADKLVGDGNGNRIEGGGGADTLDGGAGDDAMYGGGGNDGMRGSAGADHYDGGLGVDVVNFDQSTGVRVFLDATGTNGLSAVGDTFVDVENIIGSLTGADWLVGQGSANRLTGNGGDDKLWGRGGIDQLEGGAGNDELMGGTGADAMVGGTGIDRFVFDQKPLLASERDRITDFEAGIDKLQVDASLFGGGLVAGGPVTLVANATPSSAGQAAGVFLYDTDTGFLSWDADGQGAGAAVLFVWLQNLPVLTAGDFIVVA